MGIFEYNQDELLGTVESVDTSTAIIKVENDDKLRGLLYIGGRQLYTLKGCGP